MTRPRHLLTLVALATFLGAFGLASAADAQQPASPRRIGVLLVAFSPNDPEPQALRQGLVDAGYREERDVIIDWRTAKGDYDRVPTLANELVQIRPDVIVVDTTLGALATKRATSVIPIVMATVANPVGSGLVVDLAHPGGNITGLSMMALDISAKRLELLKEALPKVRRVLVLWHPRSPWQKQIVDELKMAAVSLSIQTTFVGVDTPGQFAVASSAISKSHSGALYVVSDAFFMANRATVLKLASKRSLPMICQDREFAEAGALLSYGVSVSQLFLQAARYVDKILKGAQPGDLPIEQSTKFEFVVNLKTARALGLTIPESILLRADEVIR